MTLPQFHLFVKRVMKRRGEVGVGAERFVEVHLRMHLPIQRDVSDCVIDWKNCLNTTQGMKVALHFSHSVIRSLQ
jgi:hypothetical protein